VEKDAPKYASLLHSIVLAPLAGEQVKYGIEIDLPVRPAGSETVKTIGSTLPSAPSSPTFRRVTKYVISPPGATEVALVPLLTLQLGLAASAGAAAASSRAAAAALMASKRTGVLTFGGLIESSSCHL
jgi:hypothetical protein